MSKTILSIGNEMFNRVMADMPDQFYALTKEQWLPTPWMVDVLTTDRETEIRLYCNRTFGPESSPMHHREGQWRQACVIIHGYCWFGFANENLLNLFIAKFPSPPKP